MFSISIQAGGQSTRMGANKALIDFQGVPLVERVLDRIRALSEDIFITTNVPDEFPDLGVPMYKDVPGEAGPLGGMITAFHFARNETAAIIACDMPFISPALITAEYDLLCSRNADVVVPHTAKGLEPLLAMYRISTCLPAARAAIKTGEKRLTSFYNAVKVYEIGEDVIRAHDPDMRSIFNVNTFDDLQQALRLSEEFG